MNAVYCGMIKIKYYINGEIPDPDILKQYLSTLIRPRHILGEDGETIKAITSKLECRDHPDQDSTIEVYMMNGVTMVEVNTCCDDFRGIVLEAIDSHSRYS